MEALEAGEFISIHCMLKDLEEEIVIWFNPEDSEKHIRKAMKDFNAKKASDKKQK